MINVEQQGIILIADPKIISVPIVENGDPFIDLKDQDLLLYGPSPEIPNNTDYTKMRTTVYAKIIQAQESLPVGIRFCIYEGYRSLKLQKSLFDTRFANIRAHNPTWSHDQVFQETTRLVSPVINLDESTNIPPHSTGGAFDIYLIDQKGEPLDMGIHPKDWMEDEDGTLSQTNSEYISDTAKENRKIMNQVLEGVNFVNYPTEFWHWSYGDRYWAYHKGQPHAIYGTLETSGK